MLWGPLLGVLEETAGSTEANEVLIPSNGSEGLVGEKVATKKGTQKLAYLAGKMS